MRTAFKDAQGQDFLDNGGREILVQAKVAEAETTFESVSQLLEILAKASEQKKAFDEIRKAFKDAASNGPVGDNGKPRMLRLTGFIAHGGEVPNLNGDAFIDSDLKESVDAGLFGAPYFGMIDFNHDFLAYGVWYSAKFEFDPIAQQNGIIAEGAIFAWRYTDLADKMLAMQSRQGHIDLSMACLPTWTERKETADGQSFFVIRKPVFFTTSVLDVAPADPDARAVGTEDTAVNSAESEQLLKVSAKLGSETDLSEDNLEFMEGSMTIEELVEAFRKVVAAENKDQFDKIVEAALKLPEVQTALNTVETEFATAKTELAAATAKATEFETQVATLTAKVAEQATQIEETKLAKELAETKVAELTTEVEALREFKKAVEAKEAEAVKTALRESRLAQLSKAAKDALGTREEAVQTKLISRWTEADQDEWEVILASLNSATLKGKYEGASEEEGSLTPGGTGDASKDAVDKYLTPKKA